MRKLILAIAFNTLFLFCARAQGTAEWNGSISSDWNTPGNWSWTSGSGIPSANDDVIIRNGINPAHISVHSTANCRNLKIGKFSGDYVTLYLEDSVTLNVYGNISRAYSGTITSVSFEDTTTTLNFLGIGNQTLDINETRVANININKPSGDVLLSTEQNPIYIAHSLNFLSQPVAIGADPSGNLVMNATAIIFYADNPQAKITTTSYQDNQTPPHIITNSTFSEIYFYYDFTGDKFVPISPYVTSFNPVTIHSVGESWYIRSWGPPENQCDSFYSINDAVRRTWIVLPTNNMTPKSTPAHPASISMTFQVNNVGRDVPANFNPYHNPLEIWRKTGPAQCWRKIGTPVPMPATGYVTVTTPSITTFSTFALSPDTTTPSPSDINTVGNMVSNIIMYPNPALNKLSFDLKGYSKETLLINIFDALGRQILTKEVKKANQINTCEVDIHQFVSGFYTIRLSNNEYSNVRKLLKRE